MFRIIKHVKLNLYLYNFILFFQNDNEEDYLETLSKQWMLAQMKHQASAEAANSFWDLAFKSIPNVLEQRNKKVPRFVQQRRKLMENNCPDVQMEYCFRNKQNGEIIHYKGTTAPIKRFGDTQKFDKLYEMAYVKVNLLTVYQFRTKNNRNRQILSA